MDSIPQKRCKKCLKEYPATPEFFYKQPKCRYGVQTLCKSCYNKTYPSKNPRNEKRRNWERTHYRKNRRPYYQRRYQEQKEAILAQQHVFAEAHPETVRGWKRKYAKTDRGHEIGRAKENRRRASKATAPGSFTPEDIQAQYTRQQGHCYYCHKKLRKYHIEHIIPLSRGGSNDPDNLVIACPRCNVSKKNRLPHEWPEGGRLL